ncbi:glutaminyl-peptide cyclotransferase [Arsenicibacter rosenii]|nr:glutaminyl-peptide cyclotransferase [Arsenicibacter rosenii]
MRYALLTAFSVFLLSACKQDKKETTTSTSTETTEKQPIASLTKSAGRIGDTLAVHLSEAVSGVSVSIDGAATTGFRQQKDTLRIKANTPKTGWHQLIISGLDAKKTAFADTLSFEAYSDIKPADVDYTVLQTYPHEKSSFTQGLEFYKGDLYEGTGQNGQSKLMKVDLKTGKAMQSRPLDAQHFGEGITIVNDKIYQLTWTSGVCFQYTMDFTPVTSFNYHTQGWGLTHKDTTLIMSDGSNKLYFLTPTFRKTAEIAVYDDKGPVVNLNELEYVNGYVYANIWQTNRIARIDLNTGKVVGYLDITKTIPPTINATEDVLNGIAYQPQERLFYITGKNWPTLFKVRVSAPGIPASVAGL